MDQNGPKCVWIAKQQSNDVCLDIQEYAVSCAVWYCVRKLSAIFIFSVPENEDMCRTR